MITQTERAAEMRRVREREASGTAGQAGARRHTRQLLPGDVLNNNIARQSGAAGRGAGSLQKGPNRVSCWG